MTLTPTKIIALPCYREEEYTTVLATFEDADTLPLTWDLSEAQAKEIEDILSSHEIKVERVEIEVASFVDWCRQNGRRLDGTARQAFAQAAARQVAQLSA
jgi:hypothetical protein